MIVVAGGTGTLGTRLVPALAEAGHPVRVLTRDPARAAHLAGQGVQVVRGDVRDPASVAAALGGAGTVISAVHGFAGPPGPRRARHGHPRHDLQLRLSPAGIPRPAEHRSAISPQTTAELKPPPARIRVPALGMSRATIYRKIHEYGIVIPAS